MKWILLKRNLKYKQWIGRLMTLDRINIKFDKIDNTILKKKGKITMNNKMFLEQIQEYFSVYDSGDSIELETWTNRGVNMFVILHKDIDDSYFDQFKAYVQDFDIDEEIDLHRENEQYKRSFTIRESLEDFEEYLLFLETIVQNLEKKLR